MKEKYIQHLALAMFCLVSSFGFSQEGVMTSGGNAGGTGGSVSYSIGQTTYSSTKDSGGSVAQGVQHPYEIFIVGLEEISFEFTATVYPNPTIDQLNIEVKGSNNDNITYQLHDLNGRLLDYGRFQNGNNTIEMNRFPQAIYLLKVIESTTNSRTYKIIKN